MNVTAEQVEEALGRFVYRYGARLHTIGRLVERDGTLVLDGWKAKYLRTAQVTPLKATLMLTTEGKILIEATMICPSCFRKN